jgi:hypothetical protein
MKKIKVGTKPQGWKIGRYTCSGCGTVVELEDTAEDRARIGGKVAIKIYKWEIVTGARMECIVCGCVRSWSKDTVVTSYSV